MVVEHWNLRSPHSTSDGDAQTFLKLALTDALVKNELIVVSAMKQYYIWKSSPSASVDYQDVTGLSYSWDNTHLVGVSPEDEVLFLLKEKKTYSIYAHAVIERVDAKNPSQEYLENVPGHAHRTKLVYTAYYQSYKTFTTPIELIATSEEGRKNRRELGLANMLAFGISMKRISYDFFCKCLELAYRYESTIENLLSAPINITEVRLDEHQVNDDLGEVNQELFKLKNKCFNFPQLTQGQGIKTTISSSPPRDKAFQVAIRRLYSNQCAICGLSLRSPKGLLEVQAAHIYPKSEDGSDDVRNGICLCRMHHWALDEGWISITDNHEIIVHQNIPINEAYQFLWQYKGKKINKPFDDSLAPHPLFLREHRKLKGFE